MLVDEVAALNDESARTAIVAFTKANSGNRAAWRSAFKPVFVRHGSQGAVSCMLQCRFCTTLKALGKNPSARSREHEKVCTGARNAVKAFEAWRKAEDKKKLQGPSHGIHLTSRVQSRVQQEVFSSGWRVNGGSIRTHLGSFGKHEHVAAVVSAIVTTHMGQTVEWGAPLTPDLAVALDNLYSRSKAVNVDLLFDVLSAGSRLFSRTEHGDPAYTGVLRLSPATVVAFYRPKDSKGKGGTRKALTAPKGSKGKGGARKALTAPEESKGDGGAREAPTAPEGSKGQGDEDRILMATFGDVDDAARQVTTWTKQDEPLRPLLNYVLSDQPEDIQRVVKEIVRLAEALSHLIPGTEEVMSGGYAEEPPTDTTGASAPSAKRAGVGGHHTLAKRQCTGRGGAGSTAGTAMTVPAAARGERLDLTCSEHAGRALTAAAVPRADALDEVYDLFNQERAPSLEALRAANATGAADDKPTASDQNGVHRRDPLRPISDARAAALDMASGGLHGGQSAPVAGMLTSNLAKTPGRGLYAVPRGSLLTVQTTGELPGGQRHHRQPRLDGLQELNMPPLHFRTALPAAPAINFHIPLPAAPLPNPIAKVKTPGAAPKRMPAELRRFMVDGENFARADRKYDIIVYCSSELDQIDLFKGCALGPKDKRDVPRIMEGLADFVDASVAAHQHGNPGKSSGQVHLPSTRPLAYQDRAQDAAYGICGRDAQLQRNGAALAGVHAGLESLRLFAGVPLEQQKQRPIAGNWIGWGHDAATRRAAILRFKLELAHTRGHLLPEPKNPAYRHSE